MIGYHKVELLFTTFGEFNESRISREKADLKSSKSRRKQGIDLQPFQIFETMGSKFYFSSGSGIGMGICHKAGAG